jgi:hypothetical protein
LKIRRIKTTTTNNVKNKSNINNKYKHKNKKITIKTIKAIQR